MTNLSVGASPVLIAPCILAQTLEFDVFRSFKLDLTFIAFSHEDRSNGLYNFAVS